MSQTDPFQIDHNVHNHSQWNLLSTIIQSTIFETLNQDLSDDPIPNSILALIFHGKTLGLLLLIPVFLFVIFLCIYMKYRCSTDRIFKENQSNEYINSMTLSVGNDPPNTMACKTISINLQPPKYTDLYPNI